MNIYWISSFVAGTEFNVVDEDSEDEVGIEFESDMFDIGSEYVDRYACAERGDHLPIAHALRLPETSKKNQIYGLCPYASLRSFGRPKIWKYTEGKKKKERKRRKNKATLI